MNTVTRLSYAPINVNPVGGGGASAGKGRGFDAWHYPPVGLLIVRSDPRGRDIWLWPIEAWYQFRSGNQVHPSRLSESHAIREIKGVKFSFVLIAIIRYFKLSSKQIMSILSSSSHLIVKLDWNRIPPWKSEDFLWVTDPTCSDMLSRCYKAFYVSLI